MTLTRPNSSPKGGTQSIHMEYHLKLQYFNMFYYAQLPYLAQKRVNSEMFQVYHFGASMEVSLFAFGVFLRVSLKLLASHTFIEFFLPTFLIGRGWGKQGHKGGDINPHSKVKKEEMNSIASY